MTSAALLNLAAAARAALRRSRGLAQVLVRLKIEVLFALGAAEVIRLPFVLGLSGGVSRLYVHTAHRIFHNCCTRHVDLSSFVTFGSLAGQMLIGRCQQRIMHWPCLRVVWRSPAQRTGKEISNRDAIS